MTAIATIAPTLFALLVALLLGACTAKPEQDSAPVTLRLGEAAESFQARYHDRAVMHAPAGARFVKMQWPAKTPGVVRFEQGAHSFDIPHVQYIGGREETGEFKAEGLSRFTVSATASAWERMPNTEVQQIFYSTLQHIKAAGWQRVNGFSSPRVKGKASYDYLRETLDGSLDSEYMPPIEEWHQFSEAPYSFYADGVFLDVRFHYTAHETPSNILGVYVFIFEFESSLIHFRSHVAPEDRPQWRSKVREAIEASLNDRKEQEAELRARGVEIDESYQDPPFPAAFDLGSL